MCEEVSFLDAEALVHRRCGVRRDEALLDDPRVIDYLKAREVLPWAALKKYFLALTVSAGRAL